MSKFESTSQFLIIFYLPVSSADRVSVRQSPVNTIFSSPVTSMSVPSAPKAYGEESALRGIPFPSLPISRNLENQYLDFWLKWRMRNSPDGLPRTGSAASQPAMSELLTQCLFLPLQSPLRLCRILQS